MDAQGAPVLPADEPATSLLVVDDDPFIARLLQIELTRRLRFEERTAVTKGSC